MSTLDVCVLVAGAGRAAASFVTELQKLGFADSVLLVNEEQHPSYDRPPLSKDLLRGVATGESIRLLGAEVTAWSGLRTLDGVRIEQIDRGARTARLSNGDVVRWRKLLLATGGRARRHSSLPESDSIHYMRTLDDAVRLQSALAQAQSLTVLGGGFLGLELASTARSLGLEVSVVEQCSHLLQRMLPPMLSIWLLQRLQAQGIALHLATGFEAHARDGARHRIHCDTGMAVVADLLVAAIGQTPETALARDGGLQIDERTGGVMVDGAGRTSDPDILAAGDCVASFSDYFQAVTRTESWQSAEWQGRRAARAVAGVEPGAAPVPWFWTDVAGVNLQVLGAPEAGLHWVERHAAASLAEADKIVLMGFAGRQLRYVAAVNAGGDLRTLTPLVESGCECDFAALADLSQPLRRVVKAQLEAATAL